jgi:hypothetical protein
VRALPTWRVECGACGAKFTRLWQKRGNVVKLAGRKHRYIPCSSCVSLPHIELLARVRQRMLSNEP